MTTHPPSHGHGERDYEDKDIRLRPIIVFGIYITIATVATFVGIRWLFLHYETSHGAKAVPATPFSTERMLPPEPRLLVNEPLTWKEQQAFEKGQLTQYVWSDKDAGIVRIPIDRAIELVAERGLPVKGTAKAAPEPAQGGEAAP